MILIDTIYIHNSGGKVLLEVLIKKILKNNNSNLFFFLFDSRLNKSLISKVNSQNFKVLVASEYNRTIFYKKNKRLFNHFFCFANVPPPIKLKKAVTIYFHNDLILDPNNSRIGLIERFKYQLKRKYIIYKNKSHYYWIVQSNLMLKKLKCKLKNNFQKILVFPFYEDFNSNSKLDFIQDTFLYVANYAYHKNHEKLIQAFQAAALKTDKKIILKLTLEPKYFNLLIKKINYSNSNFELINLGVLNKNLLIKSYQEANFFIYPSLKESFGLPLIEATNFSGYILAPDLEYVHEVISPSITFNPQIKSEITAVILNVLNLKRLKKAKLKMPNKIDDLLTHITTYV
tara:strand:- start:11605 stop:12636 length:1032 start_codon:yes stop_codon:yes gene_type:complete